MITSYSIPALFRSHALELFVVLTKVHTGFAVRVFAINAHNRESKEIGRRILTSAQAHAFVERLSADGISYTINAEDATPQAIPSPYIETVGDVSACTHACSTVTAPDALAFLNNLHIVNSIPRGPNTAR